MNYKFSVVSLLARRLAGIKVETTMDRAGQDCSDLWQTFGPRLDGEYADLLAKTDNTYGVSLMTEGADRFVYWATVEIPFDVPAPEGLDTMVLPEGAYATSRVVDLVHLEEAYTALYEKWPLTQTDYTFAYRPSSVWFELYPKNWTPSDPLEIYARVERKN